ncbi:MAG TPA: ABC transporter permease, partial [Gemmatimonadota bacterium]|nr:ABC transporter permease [Gemmatimonadota bacterium]
MKIPLIYNLRSVRQRPASTLATALGMGLVVLVFIAMMALSRGFRAAIVETGSRENVIVVRSGADNELTSGLGREAANVIGGMPFVAVSPAGRRLVSPEVYVLVSLERVGDGGDALVVARGVSPDAFDVRKNVDLIAGRAINHGASEILVGKNIVGRFAGTEVGGTINFANRDWTVVGHFAAGGSAFESEIWGENEQFMPAFRGEVFQSITFRMRDPSAFESVRQALENDPRLPVSVYREYEFYARQSELLTQILNWAAVFVAGIMAVGAVFGAVNTMYAAVSARAPEIAVLLTLGFRPLSVLASFLF